MSLTGVEEFVPVGKLVEYTGAFSWDAITLERYIRASMPTTASTIPEHGRESQEIFYFATTQKKYDGSKVLPGGVAAFDPDIQKLYVSKSLNMHNSTMTTPPRDASRSDKQMSPLFLRYPYYFDRTSRKREQALLPRADRSHYCSLRLAAANEKAALTGHNAALVKEIRELRGRATAVETRCCNLEDRHKSQDNLISKLQKQTVDLKEELLRNQLGLINAIKGLQAGVACQVELSHLQWSSSTLASTTSHMPAQLRAARSTISDLQGNLESRNRELSELRELVTTREREVSNLRKILETLTQDKDDYVKELKTREAELASREVKLAAARGEVEQLKEDARKADARMGKNEYMTAEKRKMPDEASILEGGASRDTNRARKNDYSSTITGKSEPATE
ncbi:hypothetical protein N0V90_007440 [Kalmusia sp. IMI 367209]|nr:hypothetical protein N0V90_007440 [Kalmusia sp. IMI 367209]